MKNRKTIFTIIFALVLALSIATVSAAAISVNETKPGKPATKPDVSVCETSGDCGVQPLKSFVESLRSLTPEEKAALLADLAEIERYENQINEIYARMTDESAERNSALWERINDEYDEKIAANEPDMTLELNEADFDDTCPAEVSYEETIKGMNSLTEKEKSALLADLAEIESLEAQIDELYYRMTDENADQLYGEIDALYEKLDSVLDRNAELWDRVDAEYDEKIAANEPDMSFELEEDDLAICGKSR